MTGVTAGGVRPTRRQAITAGAASIVAWSFDLFDLFIILFVASTIAPLFFPSESETLSLAATYASFAVTVFMRPIGSAIFGNYADRNGRKRAMIVAVFGVGIVTFLMGAVPTIEQIGLLAPIIFLMLRVVQGIFVGGVVASTHTLGTESVPPKWRGMMSGAIGGGGAGLGALIASLAFFVISSIFPGESFAVWGWRFMFFTGIIGALLSFIVFRAVQESPLFLEKGNRGATLESPLKELFSSSHRRVLFLSLLISAGGGATYYLTSGFLPTFLGVVNGLPANVSSQVLVVSSLTVIVAAPLFGHISQIIGRKKLFLILGVVNIVVLPLSYLAISGLSNDSLGRIFLLSCVLAFFGNAAYAPVLVFLNERFPTAIRATGTGLGWNLGFAIGGALPTVITAISPTVQDIPSRIVVFLVIMTIVYLLGALLNPETRKHELE